MKHNAMLFNKLEYIRQRGTGISRLSSKSSRQGSARSRRVSQSPAYKSLNYPLKKRTAEKIDYENLKIAKRIVNQKPVVSSKNNLDSFYAQINGYKSMRKNQVGVDIPKFIEKSRRRFGDVEPKTILPSINQGRSRSLIKGQQDINASNYSSQFISGGQLSTRNMPAQSKVIFDKSSYKNLAGLSSSKKPRIQAPGLKTVHNTNHSVNYESSQVKKNKIILPLASGTFGGNKSSVGGMESKTISMRG